jgi:hypothetical protein
LGLLPGCNSSRPGHDKHGSLPQAGSSDNHPAKRRCSRDSISQVHCKAAWRPRACNRPPRTQMASRETLRSALDRGRRERPARRREENSCALQACLPNDQCDDWPGVRKTDEPRSGWLREPQRRRNQLFGQGMQPRESSQSGFNLTGRHRPWRLCAGTQRCNRRRRTQTLFTYQLGLRDAATIIYLQDRKTSCSPHCLGETMETGQLSIMCRTYALPGAPFLFDVSGGRNGRSESAGRTPPDEFKFIFGSRPIFMGRIGCQRSHRKPICHLSSAVEPEGRPNNHRSNLSP